jgi:hypothetical protein
MTKIPGEVEPSKPTTSAEREARRAFRQVDAAKAMTEHAIEQKAFANNRERLKAERLAREATDAETKAQGEEQMTGPRPAGRPWLLTDDDMLRKLLASGIHKRLIAQKMKRSIGAIQSRIFLFKKPRKRPAPKA